MSAPDRVAATNITIMNVNSTDILAYVENGTWEGDVKTEEGKGVADFWRYPLPTEGGWKIELDLFAGTHTLMMNLIGESLPVSYTKAGTNYSGTALVTTGSHMAHQGSLQKQKIHLVGQGAPTIV